MTQKILNLLGLEDRDHPDLPLQQEAARRLGFESGEMSWYAFNAMLMNRIADLEERLEAHENAAQGKQDRKPRPEENA